MFLHAFESFDILLLTLFSYVLNHFVIALKEVGGLLLAECGVAGPADIRRAAKGKPLPLVFTCQGALVRKEDSVVDSDVLRLTLDFNLFHF